MPILSNLPLSAVVRLSVFDILVSFIIYINNYIYNYIYNISDLDESLMTLMDYDVGHCGPCPEVSTRELAFLVAGLCQVTLI